MSISLTNGIGRTDTSLSSQHSRLLPNSVHQRPASTAGILQHQHRNGGPNEPPQSLTPQPTLSDHLNYHQHHQTHPQTHDLHNLQANAHILQLQQRQQQSIGLHQLQHHQQNQMNLIDVNIDGRSRGQPPQSQLTGTNIANWLDETYLKLEPPNSPAEKRVRLDNWRTQQSSTIT